MARKLNLMDIDSMVNSWLEDDKNIDDDCSVVSEMNYFQPDKKGNNGTDNSNEEVFDSESINSAAAADDNDEHQLSISTSQTNDNSFFKRKNGSV